MQLYRHGPFKFEALFKHGTAYGSIAVSVDRKQPWTREQLDAQLDRDLFDALDRKLARGEARLSSDGRDIAPGMMNKIDDILTKYETDPEGAKADWEANAGKMRAEDEAQAKKDRELALAKTTDELRAMRDLLRGLELPVDQLGVALAVYQAASAHVRYRAMPTPPTHSIRLPMPVISKDKEYRPFKIKPGQPAKITTRPQVCAMRVEEIEILGNPAHWTVHDIKVENRSQFVVSGDVPGRLFGPEGTCKKLVTETIQTAMDFDMIVSYIGPEADGEVFEATCMGTAAVY